MVLLFSFILSETARQRLGVLLREAVRARYASLEANCFLPITVFAAFPPLL